jgi:hypothetical protein
MDNPAVEEFDLGNYCPIRALGLATLHVSLQRIELLVSKITIFSSTIWALLLLAEFLVFAF